LRNPSPRASTADRLGSTLFLAALAHGIVILGVTFTGGSALEDEGLPVLNVTLVMDRDEMVQADPNARTLSQRNERGSGRPNDALRPTTVLAANDPLTLVGDPSGADAVDRTPHEPVPAAQELVTRAASPERLAALPETAQDPATEPMRAATRLEHAVPPTRVADIDLSAYLPNERDDNEALASPATRQSNLAQYLDSWRRRVERVGTANFPQQFRDREAPGRPTLEVAIGADGRLEDIIVRRSSGDRILDQAALDILRMAAPFDPLPDTITAQYDVLRFAYEWDFLGAGEQALAQPADSN
jgi:protein TonB